MTKQLGILVDLRRCIGCETCTIACRMENDTPIGTNFTKVYSIGNTGMEDVYKAVPYGKFPDLKQYTMPVFCNHCKNPMCKDNLPEGLIEKTKDGVVIINNTTEQTKEMTSACPYERIFWDEKKKKLVKCDLCLSRITEDKTPLCVESCPGKALYLGDFGNPKSEISKIAERFGAKPLFPQFGTSPSFLYIMPRGQESKEVSEIG